MIYRQWYHVALSDQVLNFIYWIDGRNYWVFQLKNGNIAQHVCITMNEFHDADKVIVKWPKIQESTAKNFLIKLFENQFDMDMIV